MSTTDNGCIRQPGSIWSSCKCPRCRRLNARQAKVRRNLRAVGIGNTEAWAAFDSLVDAGIGPRQISQTIGITESTAAGMIVRRRAGEEPVLRHTTRKAIVAMAANPPVSPWVHSCGPARRLQALTANGWAMSEIARITGISETTLNALRIQLSSRTRRELAEQIREVYDRLWDQPATGPVRSISRARNTAATYGWAKPLQWDDDSLDDPESRAWEPKDYWVECGQCDGKGTQRTNPNRKCRACRGEGMKEPNKPTKTNAIDVEEVRLLASAGSNWDDLSRRLGIERESLYRRLHRDGERALLLTIGQNSISRAEDVDALTAYQRKAVSA